ncbi:LytR/AlgR family response regulator transcription factor [Dendrosporobacter sp. 1207_IL3150]|uniref:LytR/AlgR family response regulator transcription factor n=1 Tax=Dendrosporobacter sp. 1207_IL3150 TaxID=3084054 RepID=UPI002FD8AA2B
MNVLMRVIVADDEELARDELIYLLERHNDIVIVDEAVNGSEVLDQINRLEPDVVFLDIQMPKVDGLTVAKEIMNHKKPPHLVFATAYDCHAIEAFSLEAVDYLLKPFSPERVDGTVERLRKHLEKARLPMDVLSDAIKTLQKHSSGNCKRIAVTEDNQTFFVDPEQIVYIFREDRDVWICKVRGKYRCSYSLHELEEKLRNFQFFRPHRGFLVNLNYVEAITPWFNGAYQLVMKDEVKSVIPVSRSQVKALYDVLSL